MPADRRLSDFPRGRPITIQLEGDPVRAYEGEPVAVALFASGVRVLSRSIKYHRPRSFFCLSGHCAACLMRVGGVPSLPSCRAPVCDGLACERQNALPSAGFDMLAAADWLFPRGMDHHTLLTGQPLLTPVLHKIVRELGGLGKLPDSPAAQVTAERRRVEAVVVGGGPAGLACATALARRGQKVLLCDDDDRPGGSLHAESGGPARAEELARTAARVGVELLGRAQAIAWFPEDEGGALAIATPDRFLRVTAARYVYATGAYDQNLLCADNDRPGVIAARAAGRLLHRFGVRPGDRVAVVGAWGYGDRLARSLEQAHIPVVRAPAAMRVLGSTWVSGIEFADDRRDDCDLVAAAAAPLPASELLRQHGARIASQARAFAVEIDARGATSVPGVFACGDVTGTDHPAAAEEHGAHVGSAID
jgi:sarcosine oxidase subunit alpha